MLNSQLAHLWEKVSSNARKLDRLSAHECTALKRSLEALNGAECARMRLALERPALPMSAGPVGKLLSSSSTQLQGRGRQKLQSGRVAVLIFAGGQGSRLGACVPKGMFPLSPILGRSLFQLICEKINAAQKRYQVEIPLAIMTSLEHLDQIGDFFRRHQNFGLNGDNVHLFSQGKLPLLDVEGDPLIASDGQIAWGSSGNGCAFHHLLQSEIVDKLQNFGVTHLCALPIDNPLADPLDASLIGSLESDPFSQGGCEVCFQAVERLDSKEATGIFVTIDKKLRVLEYTEISQSSFLEGQKFQRNFANTGQFALTLPFARQLGEIPLDRWPLHIAKKRITMNDRANGADGVDVLKAERFNFDLLHHARRARVMTFDRQRSFAPLKDFDGPRGPDGVRAAMHRAEQLLFTRITGKRAPEHLFELRASWYYADQKFTKQQRRYPPSANAVF